MKKGLVILGAMALSACTVGFESNIDKAEEIREQNIAQRHQTAGCTFVRDHESYKNCLINTYNLNSPATYSTTMMNDGRPVAVVTNTASSTAQTACGLQPIPKTEKYEWAAPTTTSQVHTVETVCQKQFQPQQTVIQTVEHSLEQPKPEVIFVQPEQETIVEETVVDSEPELIDAELWAQAEEELKCPCEDPNDPCTHCYDK